MVEIACVRFRALESGWNNFRLRPTKATYVSENNMSNESYSERAGLQPRQLSFLKLGQKFVGGCSTTWTNHVM